MFGAKRAVSFRERKTMSAAIAIWQCPYIRGAFRTPHLAKLFATAGVIMSRFARFSTTVVAGIAAIALVGSVSAGSAQAGCPTLCSSHCHQYHHGGCGYYGCYHHSHGVCWNGAITCNGGSCVVAQAPQPTANVFVYDLYYTDAKGQSQSGGRFFVTSSDISTDWGGFDKAQNALAAAGMKTTYSAQFWHATALN
jgi:hypothetical protein